MYKSCPPLRRCTILPQRSDSVVQRVGNSVYIEYLDLEESLVEALSYERSIRIVHCPVELSSRHKIGMGPTHHIVAITLLNPTNSIAAARWIVWSG
jgi:hypothetical protein